MDKRILKQQQNELTEHIIYLRLSKIIKDKHNSKILKQISDDELTHYNFWKDISKTKVKPDKLRISKHIFLAKTLGLSFSLRLLEKGEEDAQKFYESMSKKYPKVKKIKEDEEQHEKALIGILKDEKLSYASSVILGLNDALVELTGTLAGLTLAFANNTIIGVTGLIVGIAASLSMAASGYLSSKEEENQDKNAIKAAIYTGLSYIITVFFLIAPYLILNNPYEALFSMLLITLLIIAAYTFYISVAKDISFKKRFAEMSLISLSVALISFGIGYAVKIIFGIDI